MTRMGWIFRNFLAGLFLIGLFTAPALAGWIEVRSENFVLRGDIKQKDAEKLVRDLEIFRLNILKTLKANTDKEPMPVRIYAIRDTKTFKKIIGGGDFTGFYSSTLRGPAFVMNAKKRIKDEDTALAFHEYVHHLISVKTRANYPRWYNEGYAEFLSTFEYDDKVFKIGLPNHKHGYPLTKYDWIPIDVILGSVREYPFKTTGKSKGNGQTLFYAQSWLAVHYILNSAEMSSKFDAYVQAIPNYPVAVDAFEKTFGKSPTTFEAELRAYLKANKFSGVQLKSDIGKINIKTVGLTDEAGDYYLVEAARHFAPYKGDQSRIEDLAARIEPTNMFWAETLAAKAEVKAKSGHYDQAAQLISKARKLKPKNKEVLQTEGEILVRKYYDERKSSDMDAANKIFEDILTWEPENPSVNYFYAVSCRQGPCEGRREVAAADIAIKYFSSASYAGHQLNLASTYMNNGRLKDAQWIANNAMTWGPDAQTRMNAKRLSKSISQMR